MTYQDARDGEGKWVCKNEQNSWSLRNQQQETFVIFSCIERLVKIESRIVSFGNNVSWDEKAPLELATALTIGQWAHSSRLNLPSVFSLSLRLSCPNQNRNKPDQHPRSISSLPLDIWIPGGAFVSDFQILVQKESNSYIGQFSLRWIYIKSIYHARSMSNFYDIIVLTMCFLGNRISFSAFLVTGQLYARSCCDSAPNISLVSF